LKVNIHKINLAQVSLSLTADLLDQDEQTRASRFVAEDIRQKYIVSHAFLRQVLSEYLDLKPQDIHYIYNKHGKPSLKHNLVYFNLSHSGDVALVAVSKEASVGIDVEYKKPLEDFMSIAERFFAPEEITAIQAKPLTDQLDTFYTLWTRKEAYLKMLGLGVSFGLGRFVVSAEDLGFDCLESSEVEKSCWLGSIKSDKNYSAALSIKKVSPLSIDYFGF